MVTVHKCAETIQGWKLYEEIRYSKSTDLVSKCQINSEDFAIFCGPLRERELLIHRESKSANFYTLFPSGGGGGARMNKKTDTQGN